MAWGREDSGLSSPGPSIPQHAHTDRQEGVSATPPPGTAPQKSCPLPTDSHRAHPQCRASAAQLGAGHRHVPDKSLEPSPSPVTSLFPRTQAERELEPKRWKEYFRQTEHQIGVPSSDPWRSSEGRALIKNMKNLRTFVNLSTTRPHRQSKTQLLGFRGA